MKAITLAVLALLSGASAMAQAPAAAPVPAHPMPDSMAPSAPDYTSAASWFALPGHPGDTIATPEGARPAASKAKQVAVFYIHPTTYKSTDRYNLDIADETTNHWTAESVIARQAGVFNGCCTIYAPKYRQASTGAFIDTPTRKAAFAIAYSDVLRAFDVFLQRIGPNTPFIIASHSQGAFHAAELLQDRIDGTPLARRMVVAYVIGLNISKGEFGRRYHQLQFCDRPDQTGCVLSWNAMLPDGKRQAFIDSSEKFYTDQYGDNPGKALECVNPLTFDTGKPDASARRSKGAVAGDPGFLPMHPVLRGAVSARCEDGVLVVQPDARLAMTPLPNGSLHYDEYGLFYNDIRANVLVRIKAWERRNR
ncbi:DUF3089 domain-containing protein [Novosphingobium sp. 9]|uniref:DUF3089 domain-containing protein n=1 Tax=Novosphingobium sp. 9 TaxID=2025349 RepID=UPI0021B57A1E|nr:DUF3089 domain-containing protein [Novosphingobium sp. 9]